MIAPMFADALAQDAALLATCAAASEELLAKLPAKPERDADQQSLAQDSLAAVRAARQRFLGLHVDAVYDVLTDTCTRYLRLPELIYAAAERFPGLVPSPDQMAAELTKIQADKDGREIDQGIFCGALLRSARSGRHLIEAMLMPTPGALELISGFGASGRVELASVSVERVGHAAHITFRNADVLNAEDNQLITDLETAVDLALLDDQVRVGVLRGGPVSHPKYRDRRVFSAGINLKDLRNGKISFVGFLLGRELGYVHKLLRGLVRPPEAAGWPDGSIQKPWIAAVDTFAIGGGMQLLLVMDRVIAEEGAYFSLPAAEEGIVPGLGNLRLTRLTGARLARQVILGGRRIAAQDPDSRLVCDEVVPAAGMDEAIERAVQALSAPAVAANRRMLNLAEEPIDLYREYLAEFALVQVIRSYSPDVLAKVEQRWQRGKQKPLAELADPNIPGNHRVPG